jgi:hypothetical protein
VGRRLARAHLAQLLQRWRLQFPFSCPCRRSQRRLSLALSATALAETAASVVAEEDEGCQCSIPTDLYEWMMDQYDPIFYIHWNQNYFIVATSAYSEKERRLFLHCQLLSCVAHHLSVAASCKLPPPWGCLASLRKHC